MSARYRYVDAGTLARPGPVGRIVRLALGAYCLYVVWLVLANATAFFGGRMLSNPNLWFTALIGLYVFPDVVNIGFRKSWGRAPVLAVLALVVGAAALASWLADGRPLGSPTGTVASVWLLYTFGHLGVSFVLAAFLATPGCEMRAIPALRARLGGGTAREHYCPGLLTPLDRWEAKQRGSST